MRKRILWIDDEIEFLRSHIALLETRGYAVTTAAGGDEGIRLIRESIPDYDIVLLDRQMPVKSGVATFDEIKAHWPELPVVMLAGYQHGADAAAGKEFDGSLTKPVDPSKLLLACKRIVESKQKVPRRLSDRYLRSYTENRTRLSGTLSASGWMNLYTDLARWDIGIETAENEGVRQTHAGLKSDCARKFCDFVIENYAMWVRKRPGSPLMSVDIMGKITVPELHKGRGVLVVALSGMRLDQFLVIEPELRRNFSLTATRFISAMPTTSAFCMPALASGCHPDTLAELEPGIFGNGSGGCGAAAMKRLMRGGLERAGAEGKVKTFYASADGAGDRRQLKAALDAMRKTQTYGFLTLNIVDELIGRLPKDAQPDDAALRGMIESWFPGSAALSMMKELCGDDCTVVLTSDHGNILCRRASEIYEVSTLGPSLRSMFGGSGSVDEREIFLLEELSHFRLPAFDAGTKCLMAREDYCFALPESGECGVTRSTSGFRNGGISLDEMVMPLYICRPPGSEQ